MRQHPAINPYDMKVLWFTNNPCSGAARTAKISKEKQEENCGIVTGGWHSALEEAVRSEIRLEIAYLSSSRKKEEFELEGVRYRSINPFNSESYCLFRLRRLTMPVGRQEKIILAEAREIIEASQPDIIHIHGTERCFGLICNGGIYTCRSGKEIPVAISIQGLIGEITGRFFSGLDRKQAARHESIASKLKKQSVMRLYREFRARAKTERKILSSARFILGRTEWDKKKTAEINPDREYFTVGEVMRAPFFRMQWMEGRTGNVTRLVSTLSTGPYKGFETILKTASILKRRGNIEFTWTVIGYRASEEYVRISEKAEGMSAAASGICFKGKQSAGHVADILCDSDIYCQVSHIENSPNSLCEAMLLGMPLIATDVGGTSSMLEDGTEGLLVKDNSPQAYADAIERLAENFSLCMEMGKAARAKALVRHAPETVKAQLLGAYRSIIERARQKA